MNTFRDQHLDKTIKKSDFRLKLCCCDENTDFIIANDEDVLMFTTNNIPYDGNSSVWLLPHWKLNKERLKRERPFCNPSKGFGYYVNCKIKKCRTGYYYPLSVGYHDKPGLTKLTMTTRLEKTEEVKELIRFDGKKTDWQTEYTPILDPKKTRTEDIYPKYEGLNISPEYTGLPNETDDGVFLYFGTLMLFDQFEWTVNNSINNKDREFSNKKWRIVSYCLVRLLSIALDKEPNCEDMLNHKI
eukprot:NODE_83_length_22684_cov_0.307934.p7 type:complete len:243 gc:universal NODE_83_length_22684_cov_0.307934:17699-18427(+)